MRHGKSEVGRLGEDAACRYLQEKRYFVLQRNYRERFGEIDIIAQHKQTGLLVFVEVKTLIGESETFNPEQNYSFSKARKTKRIAQFFAAKHPELFHAEKGWRVDLLTVQLLKVPITDYQRDCKFTHYENV